MPKRPLDNHIGSRNYEMLDHFTPQDQQNHRNLYNAIIDILRDFSEQLQVEWVFTPFPETGDAKRDEEEKWFAYGYCLISTASKIVVAAHDWYGIEFISTVKTMPSGEVFIEETCEGHQFGSADFIRILAWRIKTLHHHLRDLLK